MIFFLYISFSSYWFFPLCSRFASDFLDARLGLQTFFLTFISFFETGFFFSDVSMMKLD